MTDLRGKSSIQNSPWRQYKLLVYHNFQYNKKKEADFVKNLNKWPLVECPEIFRHESSWSDLYGPVHTAWLSTLIWVIIILTVWMRKDQLKICDVTKFQCLFPL